MGQKAQKLEASSDSKIARTAPKPKLTTNTLLAGESVRLGSPVHELQARLQTELSDRVYASERDGFSFVIGIASLGIFSACSWLGVAVIAARVIG
jgi:hypothetical protein